MSCAQRQRQFLGGAASVVLANISSRVRAGRYIAPEIVSLAYPSAPGSSPLSMGCEDHSEEATASLGRQQLCAIGVELGAEPSLEPGSGTRVLCERRER